MKKSYLKSIPTMRFPHLLSSAHEKLYTIKKLREGRFTLRLFFLTFILLYGGFGYLDSLLAGEHAPLLITIRFGVVIPSFLLVIASTYHDLYYRWGQQILLGSFILVS